MIYFGFWAAVIGAVFGSFVCCMTERIHDKKPLGGRSRCSSCGHVLGGVELIPIFGWLINRGRCRYCKGKIPVHNVLAEAALAIGFTVVMLRFDTWSQRICTAGFEAILLAIALWDMENFEIPEVLLAAALVWKAVFVILFPKKGISFVDGLLGAGLISGGLFLLSVCMDRKMKRETIGYGDIRLLFVTGWYLGWKGNFLNLFFKQCAGNPGMRHYEKEKNSIWPGDCGVNGVLSLLWRSADPVVCTYMVKIRETMRIRNRYKKSK